MLARSAILQPGHNAWRIEQADRASVLIDAAAYFGAVRAALLRAERSVFIVGWDIHSQTRLVGEDGDAPDGYPPLFGDFLSALVQDRSQLEVRLLLWDYSILYAAERELFPTLTLRWHTPRRVRFCLDDAVPFGSSQHQKLIVVDDAVAFSGGLDVTIRRWDTPQHQLANRHRIDPAGNTYAPFHDVQVLVDGAAARALGQLARARWACASSETVPPATSAVDPWPDVVLPNFTDVQIGIARTQPPYDGQEEVREVERLFLDSIDAAERCIYIENQFLTCAKIADRLAQRLRERSGLELVIVAPHTHESWLEASSMRQGRIRFIRRLHGPDIAERVRVLYPEVTSGVRSAATMIHSKVMVVDDRLLRIGSANLNNRSMGTDTECDLAIEARTADERRAIARIRNELLGEHCGVIGDEVAAELQQRGSLVQAADALSCHGHRLRPIDDGEPEHNELAVYIESMADPERPIGADAFVSRVLGGIFLRRQVSTVMKVCLAALLLLIFAAAWKWTPLARFAEPEHIRATLAGFSEHRWGAFAVVAVFIVAGLLAFPVTILIAATAAAFGPWLGFAYGGIGALASAVVTYEVGRRLGKETLRDFLGPRLGRIRERIATEGIIAVATVRLVPLAPFTVVNLVAGASEIRLVDYVLGTLLGMAPGLIVMSALGHQLARILVDPTPTEFALLVGAVLAWIATAIGIQIAVSKYWSRTS